ncbi:hypothetical protein C5167_009295 [Papaver somniferum]|uniref:Uncharacterized protein n=1 Tax=Papaver somniferum TaxID=3469 RepID=A0A4Y7K0W0_PAPSO|nr:hypothetical protein C5167_009295 [Papaver somniferum]
MLRKMEKKKLEKLTRKGPENATPTPSALVSEARITTSKPNAATSSTSKTSTQLTRTNLMEQD